MSWQSLQLTPAFVRCSLWLNGTGCSGPFASSADELVCARSPAAASANKATLSVITAVRTRRNRDVSITVARFILYTAILDAGHRPYESLSVEQANQNRMPDDVTIHGVEKVRP